MPFPQISPTPISNGLDREVPSVTNTYANGLLFYTFVDDFDKAYPLTSNLPVTASSPYNAKAVSTGTFSQASPSKANGVAVFSGASTTNKSGVQIQKDHESVQLAVGTTTQVSVRYQTATPTTIEMFVGLGNQYGATGAIQNVAQSATILSNLDTTHYTDFIGLYQPYNAAVLYGVTNVTSGTATNTPSFGLIGVSTWTILTIEITDIRSSGTGTINYYQDGNLVQQSLQVPIPTATKNLAPLVGIMSGTATGTITASFDYLILSNSR